MYISIGILAHNESKVIRRMLCSLFAQSIFQGSDLQIEQVEVVVVPNGCSDDTAELARQTLQDLVPSQQASLSWQVRELTTPGTSTAGRRGNRAQMGAVTSCRSGLILPC